MRERVSIEAEINSDDGMGGSVHDHEVVAEVWAKVMPAKGGEKLFAGQVQDSLTYLVTIRYRDDVTAANRLVWQDKPLNIRAVVNNDMHNRYLTLECVEGVAS